MTRHKKIKKANKEAHIPPTTFFFKSAPFFLSSFSSPYIYIYFFSSLMMKMKSKWSWAFFG